MDCVNCKGVYLLIVWHGIFRSRNFQIIAVPSCKRVDLLMYTNSGFRVRNFEKCAVMSCNEVGLLMLRNRVFRQRNDQKYAVQSWKDFDLLKLRNRDIGLETFTCGCSALICVPFAESQETRFHASKGSDIGSVLLDVGLSADFHEFWFQAKNFQIWSELKCKGVYLLILR